MASNVSVATSHFLAEKSEIFAIDFGIAIRLGKDAPRTDVLPTPEWGSPEALLGRPTLTSDTLAVGRILAFLGCSVLLWSVPEDDREGASVAAHMLTELPRLPKSCAYGDEFLDLVQVCVEPTGVPLRSSVHVFSGAV